MGVGERACTCMLGVDMSVHKAPHGDGQGWDGKKGTPQWVGSAVLTPHLWHRTQEDENSKRELGPPGLSDGLSREEDRNSSVKTNGM